jgi:ribosomal protein S27AE
MCKTCDELDRKIAQHRRFLAEPLDALTKERISAGLKEISKQRALMHVGQTTMIDTHNASIIPLHIPDRRNDKGQSKSFPQTSIWDMGEENPRPHCSRCDMRMILVQHPEPARYECLRCGHNTPATTD